jgi:hypothetical protein
VKIEGLIENIYRQICLPKSIEVLEYESVEDAFSAYESWSIKVEKVMTCFWSYQFPMAIPSSYWAIYHLKKDGYRLDVKRSPNEHGCFVYGKRLSKNTSPVLTYEQYTALCKELSKQKFDLTVDELVIRMLDEYESEIDLFDGYMIKEDPTCQMGVDDFIFLGNFEWIQKEIWLLSKCKKEYGVSVNDTALFALNEIQNSGKLLMTFSNIVIVAKIN